MEKRDNHAQRDNLKQRLEEDLGEREEIVIWTNLMIKEDGMSKSRSYKLQPQINLIKPTKCCPPKDIYLKRIGQTGRQSPKEAAKFSRWIRHTRKREALINNHLLQIILNEKNYVLPQT
ncbi:MAG: Uncharacterised protein [Prochlorococcus marinus str. MIT 9215]|nr:MAG: Uncharacterised protein [Prochlorococcus marinus str. MIT 9215]